MPRGTAVFAGLISGCGVGTLYLDYAGAGTVNADGSNAFDSDTYAIVPGGSLPVTGGYERRPGDGETANRDGTSTAHYSGTFSCVTFGLNGSGRTTVIQ